MDLIEAFCVLWISLMGWWTIGSVHLPTTPAKHTHWKQKAKWRVGAYLMDIDLQGYELCTADPPWFVQAEYQAILKLS